MSLKKTALHSLHIELGGRLVEFAGYELPVQYQGIRDEHLHTRAYASVFDISHMGQIRLTGHNVPDVLERLVPNPMQNLPPGRQRYSVLLNAQGGVIDDLMISNLGRAVEAQDHDQFYLVVNAACKEQDLDHLRRFLADQPESITLEEMHDHALIALQGPQAAGALEHLGFKSADLFFLHTTRTELCGVSCLISRSGYTGEDGFEISIPADQVEKIVRNLLAIDGVKPAGLGARDTLRLEAGLCLYGHELSTKRTPVEADLRWLVSNARLLDESGYLGRDVIKQQLAEPPSHQRVGLIVNAKVPVREGAPVMTEDNHVIGEITSGTFSPTLEKPIAMAYIDRAYANVGQALFAEVRKRQYPVEVTSLPFVPHQYYIPKN